MSYADIVICVEPLPILETWPPIYRGQEKTVRDRLRVSQSSPYVYFWYTSCLTDFIFEFIRRPTFPILSPSYWTFVELTLVSRARNFSLFLVDVVLPPCCFSLATFMYSDFTFEITPVRKLPKVTRLCSQWRRQGGQQVPWHPLNFYIYA
jgi:hypothetical protein